MLFHNEAGVDRKLPCSQDGPLLSTLDMQQLAKVSDPCQPCCLNHRDSASCLCGSAPASLLPHQGEVSHTIVPWSQSG